jgi:peptidoglycan/xylan/chitin deacetylase (PgdA/CDA1 family)
MWRSSFVATTTGLAFCTSAFALPAPPKGDAPSQVQQLVWRGTPVFCGGGKSRLVALTFDDGPGPWTLPLVAALRRANAPATFFLVGSRIALWPAGARAAATAGALGNHTWNHPHLQRLKPTAVRQQLSTTQFAILRSTRKLPALFRPPYEQASRREDRVARSLGLLDVRWNVDSGDAVAGASAAGVAKTVLRSVRPGSIVLLHDAHAWNPAVVKAIVRGLRARRLRPVTVPTLLELDPPAGRARCR